MAKLDPTKRLAFCVTRVGGDSWRRQAVCQPTLSAAAAKYVLSSAISSGSRQLDWGDWRGL